MTSVSNELHMAIEGIYSVQALPDRTELARHLHRIAVRVKHMEVALDEMVADSMADAQPDCDALARRVG